HPGPPEDLQVPDLLPRHRRGRSPLALVPPLSPALDQPVYGPVQPPDRSRDLPEGYSPPDALPRRQEGGRPGGDRAGDARGVQGPPVREGGPAPRRVEGAGE